MGPVGKTSEEWCPACGGDVNLRTRRANSGRAQRAGVCQGCGVYVCGNRHVMELVFWDNTRRTDAPRSLALCAHPLCVCQRAEAFVHPKTKKRDPARGWKLEERDWRGSPARGYRAPGRLPNSQVSALAERRDDAESLTRRLDWIAQKLEQLWERRRGESDPVDPPPEWFRLTGRQREELSDLWDDPAVRKFVELRQRGRFHDAVTALLEDEAAFEKWASTSGAPIAAINYWRHERSWAMENETEARDLDARYEEYMADPDA